MKRIQGVYDNKIDFLCVQGSLFNTPLGGGSGNKVVSTVSLIPSPCSALSNEMRLYIIHTLGLLNSGQMLLPTEALAEDKQFKVEVLQHF